MARIAVIAVSAVLCCAVLKKASPELGMVLALATGVLIILCVAGGLDEVRETANELVGRSGLEPELMVPVVKTLGIAVLTRITAEICRDAKEGGIAAFVELAGISLSLLIALPLMERALEEIGRML